MEILSYKFTLINLIDVLLVLVLSWQLFKRLKGSLAFNILIGLITIYIFWLLVKYFEMRLLEKILGQFTQVGIIAVLIVFQQEIRKFLLIIGRTSFLAENKNWWNIFPWKWKIEESFSNNYEDIVDACIALAETNSGAIIVLPKTSEMRMIAATGEIIEGEVTKRLLIAIFNKTSPLHDGAVIISKGKIKAANCVLPVSDNPDLLNKYGLRHLSAIGITEQTDAVVLVVSEERGTVSFVKEGKITENLRTDHLVELLNAEFAKEMLNI
jgi:uncharacterized protein (TIGR00159 family)